MAVAIDQWAGKVVSRFATQLHMHVINPATQQALLTPNVAAGCCHRRQLQGFCAQGGTHRCLTRQEALMTRPPLPAAMFDERLDFSIADRLRTAAHGSRYE